MSRRSLLRRRLPDVVGHTLLVSVAAVRWTPIPVLDLRCGHIIDTRLGVGQVRGWTWLPDLAQVRVEVTLVDGSRYVEIFGDSDHVMRRQQR